MKKTLLFLVSFILFCMLNSCSDGVETMLDEYNSHFTPVYEEVLIPGDKNFNEKTMLFDLYHVANTSTLCISAPEAEGAIYRWEITDADGNFPKQINGRNFDFSQLETKSNLILYMPTIALPAGTYWLNLYVSLTNEIETLNYSDSSELVIYEDIRK